MNNLNKYLSTLEQIYFGSAFAELSTTEGTSKKTDSFLDFQLHKNNENVMSRFKPTTNGLVVPAIPSFDILFEKDLKSDLKISSLSTPLLKTKMNVDMKEKTTKWCIQSGRRSALIKDEKTDQFVRIKGCGDLDQGFPLKKVKENTYEIRGCMFEHTCARELYLSLVVDELMKKNGFFCANQSLGYWEYKEKQENSTPRLAGLFLTKGEKRLADHLLLGLERLIPLFFDEKQAEQSMSCFPESRKQNEPQEITEPGCIA
jgi:hypothetical protein